MDSYTTFNFPLEPQGSSGLKIIPLHNIVSLGLSKGCAHSFMNIEWQGVQFDYTLKEKIVAFLRRIELPNVHLSYHLLIKDVSDKLKQNILGLDDVKIIDTPERYIEIFLREETKRLKKGGGNKHGVV